MTLKPSNELLVDHNHDGVDRRGFLKCMAWAGTGALCVLQGGVLKSFSLSEASHQRVQGELSFVQISDSHMGFNKPANPDVVSTLQAAVAKINALPAAPEFMLHTGDITHLSKPAEFDQVQQILQSALFPESVPPSRRFHLGPDDQRFVYRYMSQLPREEGHPRYDTAEYFDSYTKFFMFKAGRTPIPSYIRVFNKPGWSYGFLTDVAYIADWEHKVEFMLSAVIYVNSDGVLNDDKYDYEEIGYPFFKEVGNIIYRYELQRPRKYRPNLQKFVFNYTTGGF